MNTPTLKTERLLLRPFTLEDSEAFLVIMQDKEVNKFLPWFPLTTTEQAEKMLREQYLSSEYNNYGWAICLKSDNIPIGYCKVGGILSYDFGYGLRKEFWNQGIVTEACKKILTYLSESNIPYITATHDIDNLGSGKVMQKIGMHYQYSYEEQCQPKDILVTFRLYQLNFSKNIEVYKEYWDIYPVHFIEEIL